MKTPKTPGLKKYVLGVIVLALIVLGFVVFTLLKAGDSRIDQKTMKTAGEIAQKLNHYVDSQQKIPASLSEAGVKDVPGTITYQKLSASRYKFCIVWRQASSFDGGITYQVMTTMYGVPKDSLYSNDDNEPEPMPSLYILPYHNKGEWCQTVEPYLYGNNSYYPFSDNYDYSSDSPSTYRM